jgi:hypothetical protein
MRSSVAGSHTLIAALPLECTSWPAILWCPLSLVNAALAFMIYPVEMRLSAIVVCKTGFEIGTLTVRG